MQPAPRRRQRIERRSQLQILARLPVWARELLTRLRGAEPSAAQLAADIGALKGVARILEDDLEAAVARESAVAGGDGGASQSPRPRCPRRR